MSGFPVALGAVFGVVVAPQLKGLLTSANGGERRPKYLLLPGAWS